MANKSGQSNISGMNFNAKTSIFDKIIASVFSNQQEQLNKMRKLKPDIPELDNDSSQAQKKKFMDIINKDFGAEIGEWKNKLTKDLG